MYQYFSTFITGFAEVVETHLKDKLPDVQIDQLDDGLVVYKTAAAVQEIQSLRFLNNSFLLLDNISSQNPEEAAKVILNSINLEEYLALTPIKNSKTFRLRFVKENEPVAIDKELMVKLEQLFSRTFNLQINRASADIEFWLMARKEGLTLFGIRLTSHGNYEKILQKGEIRPELAYLLILLSEPNSADIFLDPFCGSGAIPIERARSFPFKQVLSGDIKPEIVDMLRKRLRNIKKKIIVGRWDATNLRTFENHSVDKIVTDPPWGIHVGKNLSLKDFYHKMLSEFNRVLSLNGVVVLLISQATNFESLLASHPEFRLEKKLTTLVNGQKAAVYKIRRS